MDENIFWKIVAELKWPDVDYDDAKFWFMQNYTAKEADEFRSLFAQKRNDLVKASGSNACCDSWDDTLAHIVGLGEAEYKKNIEEPERIIQREKDGEYKESFSYCIPYSEDYRKLTDDGYDNLLRLTAKLVNELENTDEDDVPPKFFRQYPKIIEVGQMLLEKKWQEAVLKYHKYFGPGYADEWPLQGMYGIPNFIIDLERYRLQGENIHI